MPIYDYVCSNCKQRTEVIHGINDAGPRFCPACGAEGTLTKAFSTPAVHFKGSGWAKKDRSSSSGTRTKAAAAADGKADSTSGDAAGTSHGPDASAPSSSDAAKPAAPSEG